MEADGRRRRSAQSPVTGGDPQRKKTVVTFSPIHYIIESIIIKLLLPCLDHLLSLSSYLTDEATSKKRADQGGFHARVTQIKQDVQALPSYIENSMSTSCEGTSRVDHCISQVDDLAGKAHKLCQEVRCRVRKKTRIEKDVSPPIQRRPDRDLYKKYECEKDKFPLHHAVVTEQKKKVKTLLQQGCQVNASGPEIHEYGPRTSLHVACLVGSLEMVTLLVNSGADVRATSKRDCTALYHLTECYSDRGEERGHIAELLIQRGADWRARAGEPKRTAISHACRNGLVEVVRVLLYAYLGAGDGHSALHDATEAGNTACFTAVVDDVKEWYKLEKRKKAGSRVHAAIQTDRHFFRVLVAAAERCGVKEIRCLLTSRMKQPESGILQPLNIAGRHLAHLAEVSSARDRWDVMEALLDLMLMSPDPCVTLDLRDMSWKGLVTILKGAAKAGSIDQVRHLVSAVKGGQQAYTLDEINLADVVSIISQAALHIQQDAVPDHVKGMYKPVDQYDKIISQMLDELVLEGGLFHPVVQAAGVVKMADLIKVRVEGQPLLHYLLTTKWCPATLTKLLLLRCPKLAQLTDDGGKTSLYMAVTEEDFAVIFAHVDSGVDAAHPSHKLTLSAARDVVSKESCVQLATRLGSHPLTAALYVHPPPPDVMDRGEWLRCLYKLDRNLLRVCHNRGWAAGDEEFFTFAPPVYLDRSKRKDCLQAPDVYHMTPNPDPGRRRQQRRAVILCNTEFTNEQHKSRDGARVDVIRLTRLFVSLEFSVQIWLNLESPSVVREKLAEWKENQLNEDVECVMFVVMSHGGPDYILTRDDNKLSISQDLITPLDADNCPMLAGKPKVFLIQACRGQRGAGMADKWDTDTVFDCWAEQTSHHPKADILQIYSTYDDFKAMRDRINGSWFIEEVILMAELFGHEEHLEDLIRKANALLTRRMDYYTGGRQVAEVRTSLRRKLFLLREDKSDEEIRERLARSWWVVIHDGLTGEERRGIRELLSLLPPS